MDSKDKSYGISITSLVLIVYGLSFTGNIPHADENTSDNQVQEQKVENK